MPKQKINALTDAEKQGLIADLQARFEKNTNRHPNVKWAAVLQKLEENLDKLWSLHQMEISEGEPDVIAFDKKSGKITFADCAAESPKGRRSICYDVEALESRKEHKPQHSAIGLAAEMGVEIMNETQYRHLQTLGKFDLKTSSWVKTPAEIRELGGAVFCDRRYNQVFLYHNGAESYYGARAFRGVLSF